MVPRIKSTTLTECQRSLSPVTTPMLCLENDDSVTVLDISYPDKPLLLSVIRDEVDGFTKLDGARTVAVSGDYLYVGAFE